MLFNELEIRARKLYQLALSRYFQKFNFNVEDYLTEDELKVYNICIKTMNAKEE